MAELRDGELFESDEEKQQKTRMASYRSVLCSPMGIGVLRDILVDLCHFGQTLDPDNKVQVSEYNVGIAIISKCGDFQEVTRALCSVMPMMGIGEKPK